MTWIKIRPTLPEDDRWLDAGPVAFTVHIAAMCYSDQQLTDGAISTARVRRVALNFGVSPDEAEQAAEALTSVGFWARTDDGFQIIDFLVDQMSKQDTERTRARWAADQRRRRQHNVGDHALCDPRKCPARAAQMGGNGDWGDGASTEDRPAVRGGQRKSPTKTSGMSAYLDPTRLDSTFGRGEEGREGGSTSSRAAAHGARSAPPPAGTGGPPPGVSVGVGNTEVRPDGTRIARGHPDRDKEEPRP